MKVAIMQPYFFPYLGYFQLINYVDRFILFDDVQYIRHGWINRNQVLKPGNGVQYIIAPLQKHSQRDLINTIKLSDNDEWKEKIIRQLDHYKKNALFFKETIELLNTCFNSNETSIVKFNAYCLDTIFKFLELPFKIEISSEMGFDYSNVNDPGEWALRISEQLNAVEYVNPIGGKELFDQTKFERAKIKLSFISPNIVSYSQKRTSFEPSLSILDVLMFNGPEITRQMIQGVNPVE